VAGGGRQGPVMRGFMNPRDGRFGAMPPHRFDVDSGMTMLIEEWCRILGEILDVDGVVPGLRLCDLGADSLAVLEFEVVARRFGSSRSWPEDHSLTDVTVGDAFYYLLTLDDATGPERS
jgi:hypothetical protein